MNTPQLLGALAALVFAVAALIRVLGGAFESRFSDLKKELAQVRAEFETERRMRLVAEARSREAEARAVAAELRATQAEHHVNQLVDANIELRREIELMRAALVGNEAERNEALKELARASVDRERERARGAVEETAPHKAQKDKR
jgi:hypothetical protein